MIVFCVVLFLKCSVWSATLYIYIYIWVKFSGDPKLIGDLKTTSYTIHSIMIQPFILFYFLIKINHIKEFTCILYQLCITTKTIYCAITLSQKEMMQNNMQRKQYTVQSRWARKRWCRTICTIVCKIDVRNNILMMQNIQVS